MKKLFTLLLLCGFAVQSFAVSNLKINGAKEHTITTMPATVALTANLSGSGSAADVKIYIDANMSKTLDAKDVAMEFFVLTDGIGWIRDSEQPEEDIPGDETPVDGKVKTTIELGIYSLFYSAMTAIVQVTEKDGSSDIAVLNVNIQPKEPYIDGHITDSSTGAGIAMALVGASKSENEGGVVMTDENGYYFINLQEGTWQVYAADLFQGKYSASDTVDVNLPAGTHATKNIALDPYTTFVQGSVKKEDGSAVEGVVLFAGMQGTDDIAMSITDASGTYKIGVSPGTVFIGALPFGGGILGTDWGDGLYLDPPADTLNVAAGETKTSNFVLKEYTSFITGTVTVDGQPLAGVDITAMNFNILTQEFQISNAMTKADGTYKLGVKPGNIMILSANKQGFQMSSPAIGYQSINVNEGQTVTGKDFVMEATGGGAFGISGRVTFADGNPAPDVYVVAVSVDATDKDGFLITYTNANGEYSFPGIDFNMWQIGVFKANYGSTPEMHYKDVYFEPVSDVDFVLSVGTTGVEGLATATPQMFALTQNYPNPFKLSSGYNATTFQLQLDQMNDAEISIYNIKGQLIRTVHTGQLNAGMHTFEWDGRNAVGGLAPSGVYFYKVQAGDKQLVKQMMFVR